MASVYARAAVNGESISAGRTDIPFNFKSVNVTDRIFSLFLILVSLINMCLGVFLLEFILYEYIYIFNNYFELKKINVLN